MENLLYSKEHVTCYNYEKGECPLIENLSVEEGGEYLFNSVSMKFIFVMEGILTVSYGEHRNVTITENNLIALPPGYQCVLGAKTGNVEFTIFRIRQYVRLCDTFSIERLKEEVPLPRKAEKQKSISSLVIDNRLQFFITDLRSHIDNGLRCHYYFQIKIKELLFILRAYYPKEELRMLFTPILSKDISFSEQVFRLHEQVRSVKELASQMNYSVSGFQKRFKNVFGMSPNSWLSEQRSRMILSEINATNKSFKEISSDYGFSSPSHFNGFCKSRFGCTPAKLRKDFTSNEE